MKIWISLIVIVMGLRIEAAYKNAPLLPEGLPNYQQLTTWVHRGGRPTINGMDELQKLGIKTIINLENNDEAVAAELIEAKKRNIQSLHYPINPFSQVNEAVVNSILADLQNPDLFPIYLHCNHGRDRTGMLMGLYRVETQGWEPTDAFMEMLDMGFRRLLRSLDNYFLNRTGLQNVPVRNSINNRIQQLAPL